MTAAADEAFLLCGRYPVLVSVLLRMRFDRRYLSTVAK